MRVRLVSAAIGGLMALILVCLGMLVSALHRDRRDRVDRRFMPKVATDDRDTDPDLLSTVSHELRTPLTSIRGALELVSSGAMGEVPADVENLVRIARDNSDRLMNLVNDLLDLRKMEAGRTNLTMEAVSVAELVEEVVRVMEPIAGANGVSLEWRTDDAIVHLDRSRTMQVLLNLAHNAVRHSPSRGVVCCACNSG